MHDKPQYTRPKDSSMETCKIDGIDQAWSSVWCGPVVLYYLVVVGLDASYHEL